MKTRFNNYITESTDNDIASKIKNILTSYSLAFIRIENISYMSVSPFYGRDPFNENDLKQYRVVFGRIKTEEWFEDEWQYDYEKAKEEYPDNIKDIEKDWKSVQNSETYEPNNNKLEFSVFFPSSMNINGKKELVEKAVLLKAIMYLQALKNFPEVYNDIIDRDQAIFHSMDEFKTFLKYIGANITLNILERVAEYAYRLYKDSKFFYELKEELGSEYNDFMEAILAVKTSK